MDSSDPKKKLIVNITNVDRDQFKRGMVVEKEHKDITKGDPVMTAKIVLAHLKEIPDYYTRLEKMEDAAQTVLKKKAHE
jgi:hypothetical protein